MSKIIQKRAQRYKKTANMLIGATAIILLIAGYYGFLQFSEYNKIKGFIKTNTTMIQDYQTKEADLDDKYKSRKKTYTDMIKDKTDKSDTILPPGESMTELTRLLEQFFLDNNFPNEPLTLNSLSFGEAATMDDYMRLEFTMNVQGSRTNFTNLLNYISKSGDFDNPYRLMAIEKINIVFPETVEAVVEGEEEEEIEVLSFTIDGVAYFQKSLTEVE
ncbi:hypothetical protein KKG71_05035 [Patescibacteria group bacterium]|nr:hypothetical protein [Patescibacteria group bacterium]